MGAFVTLKKIPAFVEQSSFGYEKGAPMFHNVAIFRMAIFLETIFTLGED